MKSPSPLSPAALHILLALSLKPRHGYQIMQQVDQDSRGQFTLGPATLYTTIKQLLKSGDIAELDKIDAEDPRRRYYKVTAQGAASLSTEIKRLENLARLARQRQADSPAIDVRLVV